MSPIEREKLRDPGNTIRVQGVLTTVSALFSGRLRGNHVTEVDILDAGVVIYIMPPWPFAYASFLILVTCIRKQNLS